MRKIALYGSTGSIGKMTLEVIEKYPTQFQVSALVAHKSCDRIIEQAQKFKPKIVVLTDPDAAKEVSSRIPCPVYSGKEGLILALEGCDLMVQALASTVGIEATIEAAKRKIPIAIANKETIIAAHHLLKPHEPILRPIDSEHNSLFRLFEQQRPNSIIITGSGGPFLNVPLQDLPKMSLKNALNHPNWAMGYHNTVNSSTMFNKALEVMEAFYLFDMVPQALIEPTSRIHAIADYDDGMTKMLAYEPDMRIPIAHALGVDCIQKNPFTKPLRLLEKFEFTPIEPDRYPLFQLGYEAIKNPTAPIYLTFLNEFLVEDFLIEKISWFELQQLVIKGFDLLPNIEIDSVEAIEELKKITKSIHTCITSTSCTV